MKTTKWKFAVDSDVQAMIEPAVKTSDRPDWMLQGNDNFAKCPWVRVIMGEKLPTVASLRRKHLASVKNDIINEALRLFLASRQPASS